MIVEPEIEEDLKMLGATTEENNPALLRKALLLETLI